MNGGSIKKLPYNDLEFLYYKMDSIITKLKSPLDVFTRMQSKVASAVRKIGGSGRIHGCIVDIDFFNHIYVNPIDATIHGYYATSIYNKYVYESIPALLNQRCPDMYAEYNRLLMGHENEADNALVVLKGISDDVEKEPLPYYKDHPLASLESIPFCLLNGESVSVMSSAGVMGQLLTRAFSEQRLSLNVMSEHSQINGMFEMLLTGCSIGFMNLDPAEKRISKYDNLTVRSLEEPLLFDIGFMMKKDRYQSSACRDLITYISSEMKKNKT